MVAHDKLILGAIDRSRLLEIHATINKLLLDSAIQRPTEIPMVVDANAHIHAAEYDAAASILESQEFRNVLTDAEFVMGQQLERIESYIEGRKTLANLKLIQKASGESLSDVLRIYDEITNLAERWHVAQSVLAEYSTLLHRLGRMNKSIDVLRRLINWYRYDGIDGPTLASALLLSGRCHYALRSYAAADHIFGEAMAALVGHEGEHGYRLAMSDVLNARGILSWRIGTERDGRTSRAYHLEALNLYDANPKTLPETDGLTMRDVDTLGWAYNGLGLVARRNGQYDEAVRYHEIALALRETALSRTSHNDIAYVERQNTVARSCNNLAFTLRLLGEGHYAVAIEYAKRAIRLRENLFEYDRLAGKSNLAISYTTYGTVLRDAGEDHADVGVLVSAAEELQKAVMLRRELTGIEPRQYAYGLALSLTELGRTYLLLGSKSKLHDAIGLFEESNELQKGYRNVDTVGEATYLNDIVKNTLLQILCHERLSTSESLRQAAYLRGEVVELLSRIVRDDEPSGDVKALMDILKISPPHPTANDETISE